MQCQTNSHTSVNLLRNKIDDIDFHSKLFINKPSYYGSCTRHIGLGYSSAVPDR